MTLLNPSVAGGVATGNAALKENLAPPLNQVGFDWGKFEAQKATLTKGVGIPVTSSPELYSKEGSSKDGSGGDIIALDNPLPGVAWSPGVSDQASFKEQSSEGIEAQE